MQRAAEAALRVVPAPLLALAALSGALVLVGLARRARALLLGPEHARIIYRHLRHRNRLNEAWRPARDDLTRRLLFFAAGRRLTVDFFAPLVHVVAGALALASLVPSSWGARVAAGLLALRDAPLAGVALVGGSILLQDTLRNAVAGLELTTTHIRFDKGDRVRFHAAGIPEGDVRHVTSREVVLKTRDGAHVFIPAALAVALAVTVLDDDSDDEEEDKGRGVVAAETGAGGGASGAGEGSASPSSASSAPARPRAVGATRRRPRSRTPRQR